MPETAEQTLNILLLDDHALFRESVSRLLAAEPGFKVVAYAPQSGHFAYK
jgi:DNA-binding NarL/FixJ family response regulator